MTERRQAGHDAGRVSVAEEISITVWQCGQRGTVIWLMALFYVGLSSMHAEKLATQESCLHLAIRRIRSNGVVVDRRLCLGIEGLVVGSAVGTTFGSTPLSLLNRVKARDCQAWFAFCDLYAPLVYYWCRASGLSHDETEDLAQQVFGRLAVSIGRFEKQEVGHRFRAWLWTLTRHLIQDYRRAQRRRIKTIGGDAGGQIIARQSDKSDEECDLPEEAEVITPPNESRQLFLRMLDQIRDRHSERNWQAFWRVVIDGQPAVHVAQDLSMTANHVRQAKSRILRQLRQEFGELLD